MIGKGFDYEKLSAEQKEKLLVALKKHLGDLTVREYDVVCRIAWK